MRGAALADRVASIDFVTSEGGAEISVLPATGAVLGIQVQGRVRAEDGLLSTAGVTGIQTRARRYAHLGPTTTILVRFTPQGACCLGVPGSELSGRSVALAELLAPAIVREAEERLIAARDDLERTSVVQRLLLDLPFSWDPVIGQAIDRLGSWVEPREEVSVAAVARALGLSERQLERRFLRQVGITPKRFASLRRFERAVALAARSGSLTEVALEAGYYDQSHFIRDFRRYTGASPGSALRHKPGG